MVGVKGARPPARSAPLSGVPDMSFPQTRRARPAPDTATVSSVRYSFGRHKQTTRCGSLLFEQQMRHLPIGVTGVVREGFGRGRREMGPPEKYFGALILPTHK